MAGRAPGGRVAGTGRPAATTGRWRFLPGAITGGSLAAAGTGCTWDGALAPAGPGARSVAQLTSLMVALGGAVWLLVAGLLLAAFVRRRRPGSQDGRRLVWLGGVTLPVVVLTVVYGANLATLLAQPSGDDLVVEVTGYQFWWEITYPDSGYVTANELRIPTGREVRLRLDSVDVNHSFWVPELGGKRDLIPGRRTELVIAADEPGVYRGQCAEFCGVQHANMALLVIAQEPAEFDAWLADRIGGGPDVATAAQRRGQEVFQQATCAACHAVRGTAADGQVGPDLSDFALRRTIGAGTVPNNRGFRGGWVVDAPAIKPGVEMPPVPLEPGELNDLLDYLEALR